MTESVYKILTQAQWVQFETAQTWSGSPVDEKDGFIHLSGRDQVEGVIARYYSGQRPLYVAQFSTLPFGDDLRWEQASSGEFFPHLYGRPLLFSQVRGFRVV